MAGLPQVGEDVNQEKGDRFQDSTNLLTDSRVEVLVRNISEYISSHRCRSLLDIGSGDGPVAIPLSESVGRYLAVEENTECCAKLRSAGLEVVNGTFPVVVDETFDMVLSSHSVPEDGVASYEEFLDAAWELVKPRGVLLIVTFKGSGGDRMLLREEMNRIKVGPDPQFGAIVSNLSRHGHVRIKRVNSHLRCSISMPMIERLAGSVLIVEEQSTTDVARLRAIFEDRYKVGPHYKFPMEHLFISATKAKEKRKTIKKWAGPA